jgi:hypothetical protein
MLRDGRLHGLVRFDDIPLVRRFRYEWDRTAGIFAASRIGPDISDGRHLLTQRAFPKDSCILLGEQSPTGTPLHPDTHEKYVNTSSMNG